MKIKNKKHITRSVGIIGALTCLGLFIHEPSFPTPDKLFIFLFFVFLTLEEGLEFVKRLAPFVALILVYESFRGIADELNKNVNYWLAPHFDRLVFGQLPTVTLQNWLWSGSLSWYDYLFYGAYLMHFILPFSLAIIIWKVREKFYWRYIWTFLTVSFVAFAIFWLFPAAPPWMASDNHIIPHISRISSDVWASLGLHDFPSFYNKISPNAVAAVPSLHAAWAILFFLFVYKLFGRLWGLFASIYPLLIVIGTVYMGEHYVFDILAGAVLAGAAFWTINYEVLKAPKWRPVRRMRLAKRALRRA